MQPTFFHKSRIFSTEKIDWGGSFEWLQFCDKFSSYLGAVVWPFSPFGGSRVLETYSSTMSRENRSAGGCLCTVLRRAFFPLRDEIAFRIQKGDIKSTWTSFMDDIPAALLADATPFLSSFNVLGAAECGQQLFESSKVHTPRSFKVW